MSYGRSSVFTEAAPCLSGVLSASVSPAGLFVHVVEKYPKLSGAELERRVKRQK